MFRNLIWLTMVLMIMMLLGPAIAFAGDKSIEISPKQAREIKKSVEKYRRERKQQEEQTDQQIQGRIEGLRQQLGITHPEAAQLLDPAIDTHEKRILERRTLNAEKRKQLHREWQKKYENEPWRTER